MFVHKTNATQYDPMEGLQNNKAWVWKRGQNKSGGDDHKHISINCKGTIYNGFENTYECSNLSWDPNQKNAKTKDENSAVADSGCTGNFMTVSNHLNNVLPTTNIINVIFSNAQIIRSTIEGELDLPMVPNI